MEYTSKEVYEYVSKKANDPIVEWKKCRLSGQDFPIYQSDFEFYGKVSPTFEVDEGFAKKFLEKNSDVKDNFEYKDGKLKAKLPTPTLCPEERDRNKVSFINDTSLYKRKCDFSGKSIISLFSPDKPYKIYNTTIRFGDYRNPMNYGIEFNIMYEDSFKKILNNVPIRSLQVMNNINSDYVNVVADSKNCYMCFASTGLEDCLYVRYGTDSNDCLDGFFVEKSQHCYNCIKISNCFNLMYSDFCTNCSDSFYLNNCTNCHNCFNCSNLDNKSYYINNKKYSEDEYKKLIKNFVKSSLDNKILGCQQQNCENSFGNSLFNCTNSLFVSNANNCSNSKYLSFKIGVKDSSNSSSFDDHCVDSISCPNSYYSGYNYYGRGLKHCRYCCNCRYCSNCLFCVGLQNKEFCIYNKQYSKEEYNRLVPQIITQMIRNKQWGEFFDPQLSYYGYNESLVMDFYPLSKQEALKMGYKRSDYKSPAPKVEKTVQGKDLPKVGCKVIQEKKPEFLKKILNYAIICEISKKPFRITKQEIDFYIKHNLPLPTKHPNIRHQERLSKTNATVMYLIHCDECGEEMLSVHKQGKGKKILCEKCFYKNM